MKKRIVKHTSYQSVNSPTPHYSKKVPKNNVSPLLHSPLLQLNKLVPGVIASIGKYLPNPFRLKVCKSINKNEYLNVHLSDRIEEIKKNHVTKSNIIIKFWPDIHKYLTNPQSWIPMKQLFQDATFYIINYANKQKFYKKIDLTNENLEKLEQLSLYNNKKEDIPQILEMPPGLNFKGKPTKTLDVIREIKNNNVFILKVVPSKLITTINAPTKKSKTLCSIQ